jgi:hypothetical protein
MHQCIVALALENACRKQRMRQYRLVFGANIVLVEVVGLSMESIVQIEREIRLSVAKAQPFGVFAGIG